MGHLGFVEKITVGSSAVIADQRVRLCCLGTGAKIVAEDQDDVVIGVVVIIGKRDGFYFVK